MGVWLVDADVLARSRFAVSALSEALGALTALATGRVEPWQRAWLDAHTPAFRELAARDPFARAWRDHVAGSWWTPDFVGMPPRRTDVTFDRELARLRAIPRAAARADLAVSCGGRLPRALDPPDPAGRTADLLEWVWRRAVLPDWPRRSRILEADIVGRVHRLSRDGWASALGDLRPRLRWLGEGRLRINGYDRPDRDLSGTELLFIPVSARRGWAAWDPPERHAVVYPVSGALAAGTTEVPEALARLLGRARADLLTRLDPPKTTSQLVALTGLALGSVGNHLRILLDARLAARRRTGASVLYYRTPAADALLRAQSAEPGTT